MQSHLRRTEPDMRDILDRILDKGLCLEVSALLAVGTPGPRENVDSLLLESLDTNTRSYGTLTPRTRY
jgi:hypothetical protein